MKKFFLLTVIALIVSSCSSPWKVQLTAQYLTDQKVSESKEFWIELAGTGTATIDWGDGTVLKDFQMPELHNGDSVESTRRHGTGYMHVYDKVGTYQITVSGQGGNITLLYITTNYPEDFNINSFNAVCSREAQNGYTSLVLDQCRYLHHLWCPGNRLTALNVSGCKQLEALFCNDNQLTSLDVSKNTQLAVLFCNDNQLTSLDVSKNTQLEALFCNDNQLTSLDVSKNTQLAVLFCNDNQLTSLDVSKNTQLAVLFCNDNQLTSLDVSKNTQLKYLECYDNRQPVIVMNKIYNDLPVVGQGEGEIKVDQATAGDYQIAENKGWKVRTMSSEDSWVVAEEGVVVVDTEGVVVVDTIAWCDDYPACDSTFGGGI